MNNATNKPARRRSLGLQNFNLAGRPGRQGIRSMNLRNWIAD